MASCVRPVFNEGIMRTRTALLRASVAAVGAAVAAAAAALDPNEFVAGWPIEAPAAAEVFDVPLTAEIYAAAESIEQLAILDVNGEPQSFFRRGLPPLAPTEQRVVLEASPLYVGGAASAPSVGVATSAAGTSVTVTPGAASSAAIVGFVLDARAVDAAPVALELDWRALPQPFLLDVAVEQSTDLTNWRRVGAASVAALAIGGVETRHARVPVGASAGGYFRVTSRGAVADWHLLRATLVSAAGEPAAPASVRVPPLAAAARPENAPADAVYFDAGGQLPVASVTLAFAATGGWLRADVAASRSLDGPWMPVAYGELFYALQFEGRAFANEPVLVGRREARYWRVDPATPLRGEELELTLSFPQERLRVAARGGAPYLLAAGTLANDAGPDATLSSVWSALDPAADNVPLAIVGARRELGGPAALVAERQFPWRSAALWAVLAAGVLVVTVMAVRLAQEMRRQPS
jgi:hypothetical protein